jgi:UDP-3-O-[3-hydroxymyristoyl] N-acetylglucosamine deacetylase
MTLYQKTLQKSVTLKGIGLHTGKDASIKFKPAPESTGIYFVRSDISGFPALRALSRNVRATQMATVLGSELFAISTVEHCMSAIAALELDNLIIEMEGPELPIGDGSADCFFRALKSAGIIEQSALRKYIYVTKPIHFSHGDKYASIVPYNGYKMTCTIEFPHERIGRQKIELDVNEHNF